jgi:hypothetical protein
MTPMSEIEVRTGRDDDFDNINAFAARAIRPAYDHPSLTDEQRQEIANKMADECPEIDWLIVPLEVSR